ncbi:MULTISPECIES: redox-sensing transcriptional repressor Rex [Staphylococcus]|uniref:Redox-sensing transcriptional repressor Rex n=1 Tax=Staphylococcus simulans UMC-CNS-990 TaxID=1405498 RepID=A0ABN0PBH4_STASI|nr:MULTISPECIES: redox-sensing transcriptional repressor Rex [Staphylococcus]MDN6653695.1 redox-sensing transcriptional repressor Rex [Lactobacillus sp.]AMG95674.1 redox-sensing transcriptional repressor Rex [Staphylococcus simulans]ATF29728.1 redox-sensing transcriptional repressor Rex [Staphylococcus simulans]AVO01718.1 redox-sensing transcriptional repressor Rex [Staphylococcus simulans]AVO04670.1 redox-sensing transcriptional repressor Rex [Staphylococcus simulans]
MANQNNKIPRATLKRLPLYYRFVNTLQEKGIDRVNSKTISEALDIDSATIRRDFSYFGELGKKGYGYNVESLLEFFKGEISESDVIRIGLVGVGNLGKALLSYNFSIHDDMVITEAFDIDADVVGTQIGKVVVKDMDAIHDILKKGNLDVVIITTPGRAAQEVADQLVASNVKGILNFTPSRIDVPDNVSVHHIDLGVELQSLLFFMNNMNRK